MVHLEALERETPRGGPLVGPCNAEAVGPLGDGVAQKERGVDRQEPAVLARFDDPAVVDDGATGSEGEQGLEGADEALPYFLAALHGDDVGEVV